MKKFIASLLIGTMALSLVACGSSETSEAPAATEEVTEEVATETTEEVAEEATEEATEETTEAAESTEAADPVANLIAATTDTVSLTVWASEEDQTLTTELLEKFKAQYPDVTFDIKLFRQR